MKKIWTLAFVLGLTTAVSAQLLFNGQGTKDKKGEWVKKVVINLDTLPYVQYLTVDLVYDRDIGYRYIFNLGDGNEWQLVDETHTPIRIRNKTALFNLMYDMKWVFQIPLDRLRVSENREFREVRRGILESELLFKRRETK